MTPQELEIKCLEIYGEGWKKDLAADTGYALQSVYDWVNGKHKIPRLLYVFLNLKFIAKRSAAPTKIEPNKEEK